jgi:CelD/BcsL family acetyltransferase involved in cellulose biosynthesis
MVTRVDPRLDRRWDRFVEQHPRGLIYHHSAWLDVLQAAYDDRGFGLVCEDGTGQLRGILPLAASRGLLSGPRLSSLPHTPLAGPLTLDQGSQAALLAAAVAAAASRPGTQLQIKTDDPDLNAQTPGLVGAPWEASYGLELPDAPEQLRIGNARNHARIKWAANKAARGGVEVREAATEVDLRAWYGLYLDTIRDHLVPPRPYRFFQSAWQRLQPRGMLRLLLAEQHEAGRATLLAGSIFLSFGQTVLYAFNGRRRDGLALRPNDVIQLRAIQDACRAGFHHYDFGEVEDSNQGLADFKSKWGASPRRLHRYYYPRAGERETGVLGSERPARRLANAVWRRLPLQATAVLGDLAYRYL